MGKHWGNDSGVNRKNNCDYSYHSYCNYRNYRIDHTEAALIGQYISI